VKQIRELRAGEQRVDLDVRAGDQLGQRKLLEGDAGGWGDFRSATRERRTDKDVRDSKRAQPLCRA
jgi:hypothetical protein